MKKKIILSSLVLIALAAAPAFSTGIGVEGVGSWGYANADIGAGLWATAKIDGVEPYLGLGIGLGSVLRIGFTADWMLAEGTIAGPLKGYVGLGPYAALYLGNNVQFALGARLPLGLRLFPVRWLEFFAELAPSVGLGIGNPLYLDWGVQGAFGVRFWF